MVIIQLQSGLSFEKEDSPVKVGRGGVSGKQHLVGTWQLSLGCEHKDGTQSSLGRDRGRMGQLCWKETADFSRKL